jgi:hypothetical protein
MQAVTAPRFLGAWLQIRPDSHPARITIEFAGDGTLRYEIHLGGDVQRFAMTWRVDGDLLVTTDAEASTRSSHFRFVSATMLTLEQYEARTVYRRIDDEEGEAHV